MSDNVDHASEKMSEMDLKKSNAQKQPTQKKSQKEEAGKFLLKAPKVIFFTKKIICQKLF